MKIDSDNSAIEKNLRFLEKTILDHGGHLDPDLLIKCEAGNLSVSKQGMTNSRIPLITLPGELLLPTERMGLSVSNDEISITPDKGALTDIQHRLSDSMVELYNLTDKIKNHKKSCCWFAFHNESVSLEKLLQARTLNKNQEGFLDFTKGKSGDYDDLLCKTYIHTRTIGHKQVSAEDDDIELTTDIMPIVDFINHHHAGAYFSFSQNDADQGREFLRLMDSRPLPDSNECFAYYNQMDALDSFLSYGFPDAYASYVRSVPLEFDIPKTGKVIVHSMGAGKRKGKLHKSISGLRPYIPTTVKGKDKDVLELSHILIPADKGAPNALRRVLRLVISNRVAATRALTPDEVWQCVLVVEEKIINKNISFYKNLLEELKGDKNSEQTDMLRMVAELQLTKLYKYSFDESHYANKGKQSSPKEVAAAE